MTDDLVVFLRAQLDADEQAARDALQPQAWVEYDDLFRPTRSPAHRAHIARHDPARVLADVEAKRKLIEIHRPMVVGNVREGDCAECDGQPFPCTTVRLLAVPFTDPEGGYKESQRRFGTGE